MRYWYLNYEARRADGPYEAAELIKRPGFKPDSTVAPEDATVWQQWRPAVEFAEIKQALEAPKAAPPSLPGMPPAMPPAQPPKPALPSLPGMPPSQPPVPAKPPEPVLPEPPVMQPPSFSGAQVDDEAPVPAGPSIGARLGKPGDPLPGKPKEEPAPELKPPPADDSPGLLGMKPGEVSSSEDLCESCGHGNTAGAKFCNACGHRLGAPLEPAPAPKPERPKPAPAPAPEPVPEPARDPLADIPSLPLTPEPEAPKKKKFDKWGEVLILLAAIIGLVWYISNPPKKVDAPAPAAEPEVPKAANPFKSKIDTRGTQVTPLAGAKKAAEEKAAKKAAKPAPKAKPKSAPKRESRGPGEGERVMRLVKRFPYVGPSVDAALSDNDVLRGARRPVKVLGHRVRAAAVARLAAATTPSLRADRTRFKTFAQSFQNDEIALEWRVEAAQGGKYEVSYLMRSDSPDAAAPKRKESFLVDPKKKTLQPRTLDAWTMLDPDKAADFAANGSGPVEKAAPVYTLGEAAKLAAARAAAAPPEPVLDAESEAEPEAEPAAEPEAEVEAEVESEPEADGAFVLPGVPAPVKGETDNPDILDLYQEFGN